MCIIKNLHRNNIYLDNNYDENHQNIVIEVYII